MCKETDHTEDPNLHTQNNTQVVKSTADLSTIPNGSRNNYNDNGINYINDNDNNINNPQVPSSTADKQEYQNNGSRFPNRMEQKPNEINKQNQKTENIIIPNPPPPPIPIDIPEPPQQVQITFDENSVSETTTTTISSYSN